MKVAFLLFLLLSTVLKTWVKLFLQVACAFPAFLSAGKLLGKYFSFHSEYISDVSPGSSWDEVNNRGDVAKPFSYLFIGYVALHDFIYPHYQDSLICSSEVFSCGWRGSRIPIPRVEC